MTDLSHGDAQDLLARYKRAWETRDVDLALTLFAADAEFRFDAFEAPLVGANAIRAWWNANVAAIANVDWDAERIWLAGETVLASFHAAWTDRSNAERSRTRGCLAFELGPDGLVQRLKDWSRTKPVGRDATFAPDEPVATVAG